jgi:hypothetical protein
MSTPMLLLAAAGWLLCGAHLVVHLVMVYDRRRRR